jgi:DMSO/TMAO reductase YedYZ molybdopterin-dependent catalytic subunit
MLALLLALTAAGEAVAQNPPAAGVPAAATSVSVGGDVPRPFTLTLDDLKAMPHTTVTVDAEGKTTTYEGVLLGEVLKRAGAPLGRDLSGKAVASYVRGTATDGYEAIFALAEADPAFTGSELIIAFAIDGKGLFDYQGPMRIVAPHDKRATRSVRMLKTIEVVQTRK